MLKKELEKKLYGRMEVLEEILDSEIAALCEAKCTLEMIRYLRFLIEKVDLISSDASS